MKKIKKNLVEIEWHDACSRENMSLAEAIDRGLSVNRSIGWIAYKGKDGKGKEVIILCTETTDDFFDSDDFLIIERRSLKKVIKK